MAVKRFCDVCGEPAQDDTAIKLYYKFGPPRQDAEYNEYRLYILTTVSFASPTGDSSADLCGKCKLAILDELKKRI